MQRRRRAVVADIGDDLPLRRERIEALEAMVAERPEVAQAFAMAAGRELRVVVRPERVSDAAVTELARTIAEQIEKDFVARLKRRLATLRVGDPLDKNTDIGAINSKEQLSRIEELVQSGIAEGATIHQSS